MSLGLNELNSMHRNKPSITYLLLKLSIYLTHKWLEIHGCIPSTVATDALVLKHHAFFMAYIDYMYFDVRCSRKAVRFNHSDSLTHNANFVITAVNCVLSMWGKMIIPMYGLWLHGLYGLHGPHCPMSPKGCQIWSITHSLLALLQQSWHSCHDTHSVFSDISFLCVVFLQLWKIPHFFWWPSRH